MPDDPEKTSPPEVLAITCRELRLTRPNTVGTDVSAVQQALIARGYSPGAVDGIFGRNTSNAVASFQAANGLPFTGNVCARTYTLLGIDCVSVPPCTGPAACRVLMLTSPSMEGTDVRAVQQGLAARGFNPGAIDGVFGPDTQAAVIAFQRASRVEPTGIVCDALYEALGVYCPAYPACPATIICRVLRVTSPLTTGPDVIAVQEALLAAGFNPGAIDGAYGTHTETATRNFQTAMGLSVTGVVCGETYVRLGVSCQTVPACPVPPVITCRVLSVTSPFMSGSDVLAVQRALAAAGFNPGAADGVYGPNTANAVEQFQAARSLPITGQVCGQTYVLLGVNCQSVPACPAGPITCRVLQVTSPFMSGQDVFAVQHALVARGFRPGTVDGIYGPNTAAAVRSFQTANGLPVTGIVCGETYVRLGVSCQTVPACPVPPVITCRVLSVTSPFMAGSDVLAVQRALAAAGFNPGAADGVYGPNTANAVEQFQAARSLPITGQVCGQTYVLLGVNCQSVPACPAGPITCRVLQVTSPFMSGQDVFAVQHALVARGFRPGTVDGIYGPNTAAAVRAFQTANGLPVTGIVCGQTYVLLNVGCRSVPPCPPVPGDCRVLFTANPFMRGPDVLAVQQVLRTQGFYAGALDGIYGPNTATAVRNFQASRAILTTGNVCGGLYATLGIVCSSPPPCPRRHPIDACRRLRLTSPLLRGSDVAAVQIALANRGFNLVQVDGIYGLNTVSAVQAFQTAAGLPANGVVCSLEYRALFLNCRSFPAC